MGHYRAIEQLPRRGIKGNEEEPGILGKGREGEEEKKAGKKKRQRERRERGEDRERGRMRGWYGSCGPLFHSVKVCSSWSVESATLHPS